MGVLDILFPKNCLECGSQGSYICKECILKVDPANTKYFKIGEFNSVESIWRYQGVVRKAIIKLKYSFAYSVADELAKLSCQRIKYTGPNYVLVPIPLHKQRENWRGFNQAFELGRMVASQKDWQIEQNLLTRKIASKRQVGLQKSERLRNMRGKFAVNTPLSINLDSSIIIFDDVWTTGATMREAARVLKKAGFKNIYGLTICG